MTDGPVAAGSATARALASKGVSEDPTYRMVRQVVQARSRNQEAKLLDVGCGTGNLLPYVEDLVKSYAGADIVRFEGYPSGCAFYPVNLDSQRIELADACMDLVVAAETIEHVENPRALMRELARLAKPGGTVVVTTPNNLSLLSKMTLVLKNQFNAFQEPCYPAHITALVESDLRRIAKEAGLEQLSVLYSNSGRIPGTPWHWPSCCCRGRWFSDSVLLAASKPV